MSATDFLDSNILIYAYDPSQLRKRTIAQELVNGALAGESVISVQVLAEFCTTLMHKAWQKASPQAIKRLLEILEPIELVVPDAETVRRAVEAHAAYGIHFYDGMIVASAERAGCKRIWSEDLNASQKYFGVSVANPFDGA